MLAEAREVRAEAVHIMARSLVEGVLKRGFFPLVIRPGATLESALTADRVDRNYPEAIQQYHSVLTTAESRAERVEALFGEAQSLINLGSFRHVRFLLRKEPQKLLPSLSLNEQLLLQARVKEKEGWVEDGELGYKQALQCFSTSISLLEKIPEGEWDERVKETFSTDNHFMGRSEFCLAAQGIDYGRNIRMALRHFDKAIELDEELDGDSKDEKVGHGLGWKARCYLLMENTDVADQLINRARMHFTAHQQRFPRSGVMAHYNLLRGTKTMQLGFTSDARGYFERAVKIRLSQDYEQYPKGLADAYAGIAATYLRERKISSAAVYLSKAFKAHPYTVFKGMFGG